jgi:hypothetical protein
VSEDPGIRDRRRSTFIRVVLIVALLIGLALIVVTWLIGWAVFAVWLGDVIEAATGVAGVATTVVVPALLVAAAMGGYAVLRRARR